MFAKKINRAAVTKAPIKHCPQRPGWPGAGAFLCPMSGAEYNQFCNFEISSTNDRYNPTTISIQSRSTNTKWGKKLDQNYKLYGIFEKTINFRIIGIFEKTRNFRIIWIF